ncbi:MAG: hypothetical protein LC744_05000 [Chloroflexi bacterium]|nr:hypothetical protein [Chloroflexota bacterium]
MHPNPPRLVTIAAAMALVIIGLSATVFPIDFVNQALALVQQTIGTNIVITTEVAWWCLLAGDLLLIAGSLLPGI